MKRKICLILLTLWAVCLGGCGKQHILCRYVTQVDIHCDHDGVPILRSYTSEDKMGAVLMYLRLLQIGSVPATDPDTIPADIYEITLTLSNGQQRTFAQKDHRYFRKPASGWQTIPPEQASQLYALMRHFESDL